MTKRLFVASQISANKEFESIILYFKDFLKQEQISWQKINNNHLTFKFLGDTEVEKIPEICSQLQKAAAKIPEFEIDICNVGVFGSRYDPRVIWLGIKNNEILNQLSQNVRILMQEIGFEITRENFVPHLTIARIHKIQDKKKLQLIVDQYKNKIIQTTVISKVTLFESTLLRTGAVHTSINDIYLKTSNL